LNKELTHNFNPNEPASCITFKGKEGIYSQRGATWYYDGTLACQIEYKAQLTSEELLKYGRDILNHKYANQSSW